MEKLIMEVFNRLTPEDQERAIGYALRLLEEQRKAEASPQSGDETSGKADLA